jgi:hypothetical protein
MDRSLFDLTTYSTEAFLHCKLKAGFHPYKDHLSFQAQSGDQLPQLKDRFQYFKNDSGYIGRDNKGVCK